MRSDHTIIKCDQRKLSRGNHGPGEARTERKKKKKERKKEREQGCSLQGHDSVISQSRSAMIKRRKDLEFAGGSEAESPLCPVVPTQTHGHIRRSLL